MKYLRMMLLYNKQNETFRYMYKSSMSEICIMLVSIWILALVVKKFKKQSNQIFSYLKDYQYTKETADKKDGILSTRVHC